MYELMVKSILIADSQPEIRKELAKLFVEIGYQVDTAESRQDVLRKVTFTDYAVVLMDCRISNDSGLDVLAELSAIHPGVSVIMLSAEPSLEIVIAALRKGAFDFVVKPIDVDELTEIVRKACDQNELMKLYQAMSGQVQPQRDALS